MPPWAPRPHRGLPTRLPGALRPPEQRIERAPLARTLGVSPALGAQPEHRLAVVRRDVAEPPLRVPLGGGRIEVDVVAGSVCGGHRVGESAVEQLAHRGGDLIDLLGHRDVVLGRQHAHAMHVGAEETDLLVRERAPIGSGGVRALEQGVVDVSDVLRVDRFDPGVAPRALHDVEREVGERGPEVRRVVRRDAADVEVRASLGNSRVLEALGGGVEEFRRDAGSRQRGELGWGPGSHRTPPAVTACTPAAPSATDAPPSAESTPVARSTMMIPPISTR